MGSPVNRDCPFLEERRKTLDLHAAYNAYTININHKEVHRMLLNEIINEVGMTKRAVKYYEEKRIAVSG